MDADLQDDVNAVDGFIDGFCNGNEIVYGVRSARKKDTWFKRTTAEAFYKVFEWMGAETVPDHADYRLMSRETLDALSEYHEVNLFLRGIVPTLGYQTSKVYYERGEREAGESKYPLKKMIAFAIQGITSFSTKPLSFVTGAGLLSILVAIGMFVYVLVSLGFGHAIAGCRDKALLADMAEEWPLFAATLANMEMVLAKSDIGIAGRYATLVEDKALRDTIFGRIRDGWQRTHDGLLEITRQSRLLEKHPALETSIRLRLPYIEPLNLLQIELMKRHRAGEDDARIGEGILLSINAIATALRNSG